MAYSKFFLFFLFFFIFLLGLAALVCCHEICHTCSWLLPILSWVPPYCYTSKTSPHHEINSLSWVWKNNLEKMPILKRSPVSTFRDIIDFFSRQQVLYENGNANNYGIEKLHFWFALYFFVRVIRVLFLCFKLCEKKTIKYFSVKLNKYWERFCYYVLVVHVLNLAITRASARCIPTCSCSLSSASASPASLLTVPSMHWPIRKEKQERSVVHIFHCLISATINNSVGALMASLIL